MIGPKRYYLGVSGTSESGDAPQGCTYRQKNKFAKKLDDLLTYTKIEMGFSKGAGKDSNKEEIN